MRVLAVLRRRFWEVLQRYLLLQVVVNLSSSPHKSHLWPGDIMMRSHAQRSKYNLKDDMDAFSPLVDVQPITPPSLDKLWDDHDGAKKEHLLTDTNPSSLLFAS
ncbi:hypothetical protein V6N13_075158 [Hibiscus sabdariffa]|uniref:Uncharacterized protein n=1 Tax=Hibiscus sabdariffa TaxID=183260 RepID=A0ABR2UAZ0_9ROSI